MDSSDLILKEDKLASIRKRNKTLIIIFFSLIIVLALITGRTITSLVQKINTKSLQSNRAIQEFCSPFGFRTACIESLSSAIRPPPNASPNQILLLSLEFSLSKISDTVFSTRSELALSNCSSSLSHAAGQLNSILEILRIDPDVESYDRVNMTAWISAAAEDLAACANLNLGKAESEAAIKLADVAAVVGYSKDFVANCDVVNAQFRNQVMAIENYSSWRDEVVENLITVSLFGSQYFVLIFLFCLLLRIY
ncbi:hypothetical protein C2S51_018660 [Perilla frutescens var. frutescens]|nr:hypothetical protein C2S51_018660 [Perilla frutescens var. frutescens]